MLIQMSSQQYQNTKDSCIMPTASTACTGTYPTHRDVHSSLEVVRRVEVAARIVTAATLDEVNAGRHQVVRADRHILWWMSIAAFLFLTIARATQELATDLPQSTPAAFTISRDIFTLGSCRNSHQLPTKKTF